MRRALTIGVALAVSGVLGAAGCGAPDAAVPPVVVRGTPSAGSPSPAPAPTPGPMTPPPFIPAQPPADATTKPQTPPMTTPPPTDPSINLYLERDPNRPTEDQISAFAVYALQLIPYAFATGDLAEWAAVSHPDCGYCGELSSLVTAATAAGGHSEGGLIDVTWAATMDWQDFWQVRFTMTEAPSTDLAADGSVIDEWGGRTSYGEMRVVNNGGQLQVAGVIMATAQRLEGRAAPLPMDRLPVTTENIDEPWWSAAMSATIRYALTHAYARATGDVAPLESLGAADCEDCVALAAEVGALPDAERPDGSRVAFSRMEIPSWRREALWAAATLQVVEFPAPVRGFPGSDVGKARSPVLWVYSVAVEHRDGRWQVTGVAVSRVRDRPSVRVPFASAAPGVGRGPCERRACPRAV